jgi:phosphoenolpyruvate phosphomutase
MGCKSGAKMEKPRTTTAEKRRAGIRSALKEKCCLRLLEAHSPIAALLAESIHVTDSFGKEVSYDGFWSSSLTDSTERGKPDTEVLTIHDRLLNINEIFEATTLPLVADGDTGGLAEHFAFHVRSMERLGISAVVIEDKCGLKRNSLLGTDVFQQQEDINSFCRKIRIGKAAQITQDFMVIARIESLILEAGMDDALTRAHAYIEAGADGVMIHSRLGDPSEVLEFAQKFKAEHRNVPLVCVPTSYSQTSFDDLQAAGFNIVIYANHMLRSSYQAMRSVAEGILRHGRSHEVESNCLDVKELLSVISPGFGETKESSPV